MNRVLPHSAGVRAEPVPASEGHGHRRTQNSSSKVITLATEMTRTAATWARSQVVERSKAGGEEFSEVSDF